jgi:hypothetical protein
MDTMQILCTLRPVKSFLGVFPSDLLPSHSITRCGTIIINTDPHTESGSHWLAIRLEPRSSHAYYFDSYGVTPFLPSIQAFLRRNCTVYEYNAIQLQELTSIVCGKYCCLFALYVDRGYTPKQFAALFTPVSADRQVSRMFAKEFGSLRKIPRGGQCSSGIYKR